MPSPPPRKKFPRTRLYWKGCPPPVPAGTKTGPGGWGGRPFPPRFPQLCQFFCFSVVHCVVRRRAQRDKVPLTPGILRVILRRPDVMNRRRLDHAPIPGILLTQVLITAQNLLPQCSPPSAFVARSHEVSSLPDVSRWAAGYHLCGPSKTKSPRRQPPTRVILSTGYWRTGHDRYSQVFWSCTSDSKPGHSPHWFAA